MANANLITLTDPRSAAAEAFRTLRTNLMFSGLDKPLETIMITSTAEADGKSEALANLAVTFAQAGNRTLIVDSDLRRPSQHTIWGANNERGLTTMILEDATLSDPPLQSTEIDNLSLLTAGPLPPIPADVISSQRMSEIVGILRARADYILFDSPPVLTATDATLLGTKMDGVLLVIKAGATRRDHAIRTRETLERVRVPLLGTVLTNAPRNEGVGKY